MKKVIFLALVFAIFISSHLVSETLDCQQSFELGENNAKNMHRSWQWYLLGIGTVILAIRVYGMVETLLIPTPDYDDPWVRALPLFGGAVVLIAPFVPALVPPKGEIIFPYIGEDVECYRDGYVKRARLKNASALLLGEVTASAAVVMLAFVFVTLAFG